MIHQAMEMVEEVGVMMAITIMIGHSHILLTVGGIIQNIRHGIYFDKDRLVQLVTLPIGQEQFQPTTKSV